MKLCLITNYVNKGYIEETLILNQLIDTLNLSSKDIIEFKDENQVHNVNQNYTHSIILINSEITSYQFIKNFLSELSIPKIFVIDTIPEVEKLLNTEFVEKYNTEKDFVFSTLKPNEWDELYYYADAFVFYNNIDLNEFSKYYKTNLKIAYVIPPSLGNKEEIILKSENIIKNKNIGYNGTPSYSKGIFNLRASNKFTQKCNIFIYGSQGKNPLKNEQLINYLTQNYDNINFNGKLKKYKEFYLNTFLYFDCSLYNSFNYFMYLSLINGVIPIISKKTSSSEYLPNYPFTTEYSDLNSINNTINKIYSTPVIHLKDILETAVSSLLPLNHESNKNLYIELIQKHLS